MKIQTKTTSKRIQRKSLTTDIPQVHEAKKPADISSVYSLFESIRDRVLAPSSDAKFAFYYVQDSGQFTFNASWRKKDGVRHFAEVRFNSLDFDDSTCDFKFAEALRYTSEQIQIQDMRVSSSEIGKRKYPPHGVVYMSNGKWVPCVCSEEPDTSRFRTKCPACDLVSRMPPYYTYEGPTLRE
jgi:hypothetical protein